MSTIRVSLVVSCMIVAVGCTRPRVAPQEDAGQDDPRLAAEAAKLESPLYEEEVKKLRGREEVRKVSNKGWLGSRLVCKGVAAVSATYNAYGGWLELEFHRLDAIDESLRALTANGVKVFAAKKSVVKVATISTRYGHHNDRGAKLDRVATTWPKVFTPGQEVQVAVAASTVTAMQTSKTRFGYRPYSHQGYHLTMRVLTDEERAQLSAYVDLERDLAAEALYLSSISVGSARGAAGQRLAERHRQRTEALEQRRKALAEHPGARVPLKLALTKAGCS
jgi:hypothetical protein